MNYCVENAFNQIWSRHKFVKVSDVKLTLHKKATPKNNFLATIKKWLAHLVKFSQTSDSMNR